MVAVITLTRDRLEYTKKSFASLYKKAGVSFKHIIVDNGSQDNTVNWLHKRYIDKTHRILYFTKNVGIMHGMNTAFQIAKQINNVDFILKMDNDCEILTDNLLRKLIEAYRLLDNKKVILSPYVKGIVHQMKRFNTFKKGSYEYGAVGHIGGISMFMPKCFLDDIDWKIVAKLPYARGVDSYLSSKAREKGYALYYVENLYVNHIDTTDGQAKKYPEYFERKRIEEKTYPEGGVV